MDTVDIITDSSSARNYWRIIKNRLKNKQKELVTECNQLKIRINDGKFYLTDVADKRILL